MLALSDVEYPSEWATEYAPNGGVYRVGQSQGQRIGKPGDDAYFRQLALLTAEDCLGFEASKVDYDLLIAPGEDERMRLGMRKMSSCGLFVRGWLRLLGVDNENLRSPYRIGMAFTDVFAVAREVGATTRTSQIADLRPADVAIIGDGMLTHMLIVSEVSDGVVHSIDGGQVSPRGRQIIIRRDRKHSKICIGNRPLMWRIDTAKLRPLMTRDWMRMRSSEV